MKTLGIFCALILTATATALSAAEKKKSTPRSASAKVVPFERLQTFLPDMAGWKRGEIRGETVIEETSISRVQVNYDNGESSLSFELMDTGMDKNLLAELKDMIKPGYSEKQGGTYIKATTVAGHPATEEWTKEARNGYISVLAGGRFVLKVTGSGVTNVEVIRQAVEAVDLKKLAALK